MHRHFKRLNPTDAKAGLQTCKAKQERSIRKTYLIREVFDLATVRTWLDNSSKTAQSLTCKWRQAASPNQLGSKIFRTVELCSAYLQKKPRFRAPKGMKTRQSTPERIRSSVRLRGKTLGLLAGWKKSPQIVRRTIENGRF